MHRHYLAAISFVQFTSNSHFNIIQNINIKFELEEYLDNNIYITRFVSEALDLNIYVC